ncbi:MAG TPA: peptide-methionine (R)-S-oxide reductase MsrB [Candidatus Saccharimonadales bacterium]|nr:peptide-methionine (R)-S-oxide reductase MsrB [Candidatus Saccharimonadales bacterium]
MKQLSEDEWKKKLTPEQYRVLREKGTELPFTGKFDRHSETGMYTCAACGAELFKSDNKFDAHCGWPSFYDVVKSDAVKLTDDDSHGTHRTEVTCSNCGGHLGHLFDDAPDQPTGLRYCINSVSLDFAPKSKTA